GRTFEGGRPPSARRAHGHGTPDCAPRRRRPIESGDRSTGVRLAQDRRGKPRRRLPQARHLVEGAACARARRRFVGISPFPRDDRLPTLVVMETMVAECFWPDVGEDDVRALEQRIEACRTDGVRYLGSMLIQEDEVLLCQFEGAADAVRQVAERARVPFERLLATNVVTPTKEWSTDA